RLLTCIRSSVRHCAVTGPALWRSTWTLEGAYVSCLKTAQPEKWTCESPGPGVGLKPNLQRKKIMLPTMSIEEVQATLPEIISKLGPGEEVVITKDNQPVAELR